MSTRKLINDYTFYKIVNINGDIELCYVGSTVNFKERARTHRYNCNNEKHQHYNRKIYKTIRENGGWCEFKMIEIGTAEQLTKRQAEKIEEEYRVKLNAKLNSYKCFTTEEEKKEHKKEHMKEWADNNKEKIAEKMKEYYEKNKENYNNKEYYQNNKEKMKEYYQNNKEKFSEHNKKYYEKNKKIIAEKPKEKSTCECGCIVNRDGLSSHKRTQKHIKLMEELVTKNK